MKVRLIIPNCNVGLGEPLNAVQEYGPTIANIAGGFTASQAVGGWKDDTGTLIVESVTVFDIEDKGNRTGDWRRLSRLIARELKQDCVYLEIDGKVELVKPEPPSQPVGR